MSIAPGRLRNLAIYQDQGAIVADVLGDPIALDSGGFEIVRRHEASDIRSGHRSVNRNYGNVCVQRLLDGGRNTR